MRRAAFLLLLVACGDNLQLPSDASSDAPSTVLAHCIDSPTQIVQPPNGTLPCDLLPPGFTQ
jgi:hypothetical protein